MEHNYPEWQGIALKSIVTYHMQANAAYVNIGSLKAIDYGIDFIHNELLTITYCRLYNVENHFSKAI